MPASGANHFATTRRGFLRLAGTTAALTALAQVRSIPAASASASQAGAFFSPAEQEILTQIAERIVGSATPGAPRVRDTRAVSTIDALCASLDPALTAPLPTLLRVVDYAPFVFDLRFRRFTRLTPAEQDASLDGWMRSRFALRRQAFYALRNLALLGYYSQDPTWPTIGYAGPLLGATTEPA